MKTKRVFLMLIAMLAAFCVSVYAGADLPKPTYEFYFADYAGVLSSDVKELIVSENEKMKAQSGAQIVVATVDTTGETPIRDYAYQLFNYWEIGDKDKNNGILLLIAIEDDDYWVLQGTGLAAKISDSTLSDILYEYLEPDFAKKNYSAGVEKVFNALVARIEYIYGEGKDDDGLDIASVIIVFVIIIIVILLISGRSGPGPRRYRRSMPVIFAPRINIGPGFGSGFRGGGGFSGGHGGFSGGFGGGGHSPGGGAGRH